ncbi:MAG: DUF1674 domain-containing protein [Alphaproteobacteria bacterium]|nr:DUF1674 domain-containing protein [Alphaproteobacteria bacterium]
MTEAPTPTDDVPDAVVHNADLPGATPHRPLTDLERRVLEEAAARNAEADAAGPTSDEVGGPRGPEPTRYGDWERKGLAVDF